jgi:hypothetical protein
MGVERYKMIDNINEQDCLHKGLAALLLQGIS